MGVLVRRWMLGVLVCLGFSGAATIAKASLILDISDAGSGTTRWVFNGSTVALADGGANSFWGVNFLPNPVAEYPLNGSFPLSSILSGSGTLSSTSGGTYGVVDVAHVYGGNLPGRVTPRVSFGNSTFSWLAGDTLSWNGDLITSADISLFISGVYTTSQIIHNCDPYCPDGLGFISDEMVLTIGPGGSPPPPPPESVPEPTTTALLALGLLGAGFARKRRTH
jgi:hypothetical protein